MLAQMEAFASGSWTGSVWGENSQYKFRLYRRNETRPWVILDVTKFDEPPENADKLKKEAVGLLFFEPYVGLPELYQSAGFELIDVSPEEGDNSDGLVRVTFRYAPKDPTKDWQRSGVVVLDPSRDWVIRRTELEEKRQVGNIKVTGKYTGRIDYKENGDQHVIKAETRKKIWNNGTVVNEITMLGESELRPRKSIPESEFTLSAFGLPEPHWARPKSKPWYLWFAIAGLVCLSLGGGVAWVKRRRAAGALKPL
jgi:hypothetical protein